jgi:hypothetical protein
VCKDGSQTWDTPRATFKACCFGGDPENANSTNSVGHQGTNNGGATSSEADGGGAATAPMPAVLVVKAREVKRGPLGQRVLLGRQECDLLRLMAPRPIALSLPLNQSGSLKLAMLVVWR